MHFCFVSVLGAVPNQPLSRNVLSQSKLFLSSCRKAKSGVCVANLELLYFLCVLFFSPFQAQQCACPAERNCQQKNTKGTYRNLVFRLHKCFFYLFDFVRMKHCCDNTCLSHVPIRTISKKKVKRETQESKPFRSAFVQRCTLRHHSRGQVTREHYVAWTPPLISTYTARTYKQNTCTSFLLRQGTGLTARYGLSEGRQDSCKPFLPELS